MNDQTLKSLGRYTIKGVLGQGAMGLVYDGHDPKLNRRVAIKTILTRKLSPDARNVNELTSQALTDMGGGATFHDALVEVEPLVRAAAGEAQRT